MIDYRGEFNMTKGTIDGVNQGFKVQNNKEIAQNIHDSIVKTSREPYEFVAFVNGPSKTRLRYNRLSL